MLHSLSTCLRSCAQPADGTASAAVMLLSCRYASWQILSPEPLQLFANVQLAPTSRMLKRLFKSDLVDLLSTPASSMK